ncbi:hypothetical protein HanPSC8_Chr14g0596621 [Helianthus annuus]|nr:hypothetical protein HanPSC8_Chr14g0596621 [Helianthus annuus]
MIYVTLTVDFSSMTWNSVAPRPSISLRLRGFDFCPPVLLRWNLLTHSGDFRFSCCCSDKLVSNRRIGTKGEERKSDLRKNGCTVRVQAAPTWRFASSQYVIFFFVDIVFSLMFEY